MKTSLFNLHEIKINEGSVIIEFYAGDIFDIHSDILLLSAYKGQFFPTPGTTWGSLFIKTGISVIGFSNNNSQRISENILTFQTTENNCFNKLVALELSNLNRRNSFSTATLMSRYREFSDFLEKYPSENDESISLPLLGTGNQGLSLEDSIAELLKTFNQLKKTKLKIIRVFARDFESIGVLNKKINELLNRIEVVHTSLLIAAMNEAKAILNEEISSFSFETLTDLISLADSNHASFNSFGIKGRIFAERISEKLILMYGIVQEEPSTLHSKISGLTPMLLNDRPYVLSHLRLLQTYGNHAAHGFDVELNHQDAASIIISMIRLVDFYEYNHSNSTNQN